MAFDPKSALSRARTCIRIEIDALRMTARGLGREFSATARAVETTFASGRKLIFSGVGKSAHIAQKIAATFNSTGVSSCFLDSDAGPARRPRDVRRGGPGPSVQQQRRNPRSSCKLVPLLQAASA